MLYGRTQYNPPSRFMAEIPETLIRDDTPPVHEQTHEEREQRAKEYIKNSKYRFDEFTVGQNLFKAEIARNKEVSLQVGDRVTHLSFGDGVILSIRQMGSDNLYEVMFDKVGTKKLMASYAKLKKID